MRLVRFLGIAALIAVAVAKVEWDRHAPRKQTQAASVGKVGARRLGRRPPLGLVSGGGQRRVRRG